MVSIRRVSGSKNPAEMTYYVQHNGVPLLGASAAKVLNTVDSQTMALTLGYFVQLQAERKHSILLAFDKKANRQKHWQTRHANQNTWLMLSLERSSAAAAGLGGVEEKVEKALCSLISLKRSRQDIVCLGCSAAWEKLERKGEGKTGWDRAGQEKEHAAFSYRLLPTIAESGIL